MRNAFLFFALFPLLAAACGVGTNQSQIGEHEPPTPGPSPHPQPQPSPDDAGPDANCSSQVAIACLDCEGNAVPGQCVNGSYECPRYGCPAEPPDAGCNGVYSCPDFCSPFCENNTWNCSCEGFDASTDAIVGIDVVVPPDPDAGPPPPIQCGDTYCYARTTYCQVTTGGAALDAATGFECIPLPSTCTPGAASCACIQALQGIGCGCVDDNGGVTITCQIP